MTTAGVSSPTGAVLPAVSTILPVATNSSVNDVLTSTLGKQECVVPPTSNFFSSVGGTVASVERVDESSDDTDADVDDDSDDSESHGGGTVAPTEKKRLAWRC